MKKRKKSVAIPLLVSLLLILSMICGCLLFANSSQRKHLLAERARADEAEDREQEWEEKAARLEEELLALQTALQNNQQKEEQEKEAKEKKEKPAEEEPKADLSDLENLAAQTLVDPKMIDRDHLDRYFQCFPISDQLFERIHGDDRSYKNDCTVPLEELSYMKVLHYDYKGNIRVGEMIIHTGLSEDLLYIFKSLFEQAYPIEKMLLVEAYGADDDASVNDNNSSCFNYRLATDSTELSAHATGCAVDINPLQNPYFRVHEDGSYDWDNLDAELYWDRTADPEKRHMITHDDLCYRLFTERGFTWGGDWSNPIDYQHFEKMPTE